jgi:hypothetical protein
MILFWSPWKQPQDHRRTDIPAARRARVAAILRAGTYFEAWCGWATCRMCGAELGTQDLTGFGFIWPEKAEHYILEHDVWMPEMDRLLDAADKAATR